MRLEAVAHEWNPARQRTSRGTRAPPTKAPLRQQTHACTAKNPLHWGLDRVGVRDRIPAKWLYPGSVQQRKGRTMAKTTTDDLIRYVHSKFSLVCIGGIPSLLNDNGAFLSFICTLTATEALGGFLKPKGNNSTRFKSFVRHYFPAPLNGQGDDLWKMRNTAVHGFSPGPYKLTHHHSEVHLTTDGGQIVLNAEDFYAALVTAARTYFNAVRGDAGLRAAFEQRANDPDTGLLAVGPLTGKA